MDGDVVGQRPDLLQLHLLDAGRLRLRGRRDRIEPDHAHPERVHAYADLAPDATEPEDGERLAVQLRAGVQLPVPAALLHAGGRRADGAGQRPDQEARQLARRNRIAAGSAVWAREAEWKS